MEDVDSDQTRRQQGVASAGNLLVVLGTGLLLGWAAGVSALFAAEVPLFADLPALPAGDLFAVLVASGLRLVPLGLLAAVILVLAMGVFGALRRRPVKLRTMVPLMTGLLLAALLLPPAAVLFAGGALSLAGGLVLLALGGALAVFLGWLLTRQHAARALGSIALLALLAPAWLVAVTPLAGLPRRPATRLPSADGCRVVLLGLDAATWDIIDHRLTPEDMPNVQALAARGVRTTLRSLEPILSNIVWTSAATGVVPPRHGIDGFQFDRRFVQVPTVWDLVHEAGGGVGLFKYLVTEPPLPVRGFILPGWMTRDPENTHPPGLVPRLRVLTSLHHPWPAARFLLRERRRDYRFGYRDRVMAWQYATAFIDLHRRFDPDVAACIWFGTDVLGHKTWRYMAPEDFDEPLPPNGDRFAETLLDYYRAADAQIGRVIRALDDGQTFFILMSDHGMGPMANVERRAHIRGRQLLEILDLADRFYIPSPHTDLLINARLPGRVDPAPVSPAEHEAAVAAAAERLLAVRRADEQQPLFDVQVDLAAEPDLRVRVRDPRGIAGHTRLRIGERTLPAWRILQLIELSGSHRLDGILVMAGPGLAVGHTTSVASIMDVAPTILRGLGLPVAADLDGRVMEWAFTRQWLSAHPQVTVPAYAPRAAEVPTEPSAPSEELLEQLRSLGYIQ